MFFCFKSYHGLTLQMQCFPVHKVSNQENDLQNFLPSYILHILIKNKAENAFDMFESTERRKIRLKEDNGKLRHLKKLTCKETLRQMFVRVIDWSYSQSCWIFRPSFVNCCPSNLFSGSTSPLPPFLCQSTVYTDSVWLGGGAWGVLSPVGNHIRQEFNTLHLTRFRIYYIPRSPKTKTQEGEGPQTDKHLPQNPFTGEFFYMTTFGFGVNIVNQSMLYSLFILYSIGFSAGGGTYSPRPVQQLLTILRIHYNYQHSRRVF